MGKLIVSTHMTLDGVIGPAPHEWSAFDADGESYKLEQIRAADAFLLGRKVYEGLAAFWPTATDDTGFADRTNAIPKYVASRTLTAPLTWNATLLDGDLAPSVTEVKRRHPGNLISFGCGDLAYELVERGVVDEVHFWVQPAVWADGDRAFHGRRVRLEPLTSTRFASGATLLTYRPAA